MDILRADKDGPCDTVEVSGAHILRGRLGLTVGRRTRFFLFFVGCGAFVAWLRKHRIFGSPLKSPGHVPGQVPSRAEAPWSRESPGQRWCDGYLCDARLGSRQAVEQSTGATVVLASA